MWRRQGGGEYTQPLLHWRVVPGSPWSGPRKIPGRAVVGFTLEPPTDMWPAHSRARRDIQGSLKSDQNERHLPTRGAFQKVLKEDVTERSGT